MTREQARQVLLDAVQQWRDVSAAGQIILDSKTQIIGGVEGFDSFSGLAATVHLSAELNLENLGDNVFLSEDGRRARTHKELIDLIVERTASIGAN